MRRQKNKFDWKTPTVQMLGCWQTWLAGHQALFKRFINKIGQVTIQVPDANGVSFSRRLDNLFNFEKIRTEIISSLAKENFLEGIDFEIML